MLPLGFGCGGLMWKANRRKSIQLIETAIDCGIRYFDTARLYGFGKAEAILGEVMTGNRSHLVVATKAGILPSNRSILVRVLNRAISRLHDVAPKTRERVPLPTAAYPRFRVFEISEMRKSIETSLRALQTDYIDILLLHECTAADVNDELLKFLQDLEKNGIIRGFGIATDIVETVQIAKVMPKLSAIIQIPSSAWNMNIARLPSNANRLIITHSSLGSEFNALANMLLADERLAMEWQSKIDIDPRDTTALAQVLLAHAVRANSSGLVLFSSTNPMNIRKNVKAIRDDAVTSNQIDALDALLKDKPSV